MQTHAQRCKTDRATRELTPASGARLERLPAVIARTGLSRTAIWRRAGDDFPAPVRLGPQTIAWVSDEVDQWIAERIAASRSQVTK